MPEHAALPDGDDVLVGIDGSPQARRALDWAIDEAARRNARLTVAQAWYTPVPVPPAGLVITPVDPELFREAAEDDLSTATDEALAAARRRDHLAGTAWLLAGGDRLASAAADLASRARRLSVAGTTRPLGFVANADRDRREAVILCRR